MLLWLLSFFLLAATPRYWLLLVLTIAFVIVNLVLGVLLVGSSGSLQERLPAIVLQIIFLTPLYALLGLIVVAIFKWRRRRRPLP